MAATRPWAWYSEIWPGKEDFLISFCIAKRLIIPACSHAGRDLYPFILSFR
jgi:hypothetical protein